MAHPAKSSAWPGNVGNSSILPRFWTECQPLQGRLPELFDHFRQIAQQGISLGPRARWRRKGHSNESPYPNPGVVGWMCSVQRQDAQTDRKQAAECWC